MPASLPLPPRKATITSEYGVGYHAYAVYVDEHMQARISPPAVVEAGAKVDKWTEEGIVHWMPYEPPLNDEEVEVLKRVMPKVDNLYISEIDKFITGARPLSEYEAFQQQLIGAGAQELERVFNQAYDRMR